MANVATPVSVPSAMLDAAARAPRAYAGLFLGAVTTTLTDAVRRVPPLTPDQITYVRAALGAPDGVAMPSALATAWLSNPWLWLGAALTYTAPGSCACLAWLLRALSVGSLKGKGLPCWCRATLLPPISETVVFTTFVEHSWSPMQRGCSARSAGAQTPGQIGSVWWALPLAILAYAPRTLLSTTIVLAAAAVAGRTVHTALQMVASQLLQRRSTLPERDHPMSQ